jgi:hypothetical protein
LVEVVEGEPRADALLSCSGRAASVVARVAIDLHHDRQQSDAPNARIIPPVVLHRLEDVVTRSFDDRRRASQHAVHVLAVVGHRSRGLEDEVHLLAPFQRVEDGQCRRVVANEVHLRGIQRADAQCLQLISSRCVRAEIYVLRHAKERARRIERNSCCRGGDERGDQRSAHNFTVSVAAPPENDDDAPPENDDRAISDIIIPGPGVLWVGW